MELKEWATRILSADTLEEKLLSPDLLTDRDRGKPVIFNEPVRPAGMEFHNRTKEEKLPPFHLHKHEENRAICLHRFAGHGFLGVGFMNEVVFALPLKWPTSILPRSMAVPLPPLAMKKALF